MGVKLGEFHRAGRKSRPPRFHTRDCAKCEIQYTELQTTSFDAPFADSSRKHNFLVSCFYGASTFPLARLRSMNCVVSLLASGIFADIMLISSSILRARMPANNIEKSEEEKRVGLKLIAQISIIHT